MATFNYTRIKATVERLLTKFGQACTITTTNRNGSTVVRTAKVVEINTVRHILGDTGVQIGDRVVLINAIGAPVVGDSLVRLTGATSERWMVVDPVASIKPADQIIGYECYLRQA